MTIPFSVIKKVSQLRKHGPQEWPPSHSKSDQFSAFHFSTPNFQTLRTRLKGTSSSLPTADSMFCFYQPPRVGHTLTGISKWRAEQGDLWGATLSHPKLHSTGAKAGLFPTSQVWVPAVCFREQASPLTFALPLQWLIRSLKEKQQVSSPKQRLGLSFSFTPSFHSDLTPLCVAKIPYPTISSSQDLHQAGAEPGVVLPRTVVDFLCLWFFSL